MQVIGQILCITTGHYLQYLDSSDAFSTLLFLVHNDVLNVIFWYINSTYLLTVDRSRPINCCVWTSQVCTYHMYRFCFKCSTTNFIVHLCNENKVFWFRYTPLIELVLILSMHVPNYKSNCVCWPSFGRSVQQNKIKCNHTHSKLKHGNRKKV